MTGTKPNLALLSAQAKIWLFEWREIGGHFAHTTDRGVWAWRDVPEGDHDEHQPDEDRLLDLLRDDELLRGAVIKLALVDGILRPFGSVGDA